MLKKLINVKVIASAILLAASSIIISCEKDDDADGAIQLMSFGPSVLRGQELRFIGTNLDQVSAIVLPVNVEIPASSFKTQTASLIVIDVPDAAVEGTVTLRTPDGDIVSKTALSILEPITISSISPSTVRPGEMVTITGTYLNLIEAVTFSVNKTVTGFESQSQTSIVVMVPDDAQTGTILLTDGETIPNVIESENELAIKLPTAATISPNPVKAGMDVTITGTDLDLAVSIEFGGNQLVDGADFKSKSATEIVVTVPASTDDGKLKLLAASSQKSESPVELVMVVPTITSMTGVSESLGKNNNTVTITGTDLDLVMSVTFGGGKQASVEAGGTPTQITAKIPVDATEGTVTFNTASGKSASSPAPLALVKPVITSFTPATVETEDSPSITIDGTDLDLVSKIIFGGEWETSVTSASATQIVISVTPGSITGAFKLITTNGTEVVSDDPLTIMPDVPSITSAPSEGFIGSLITLTGTNMNVPADIIFPGDIKATLFGTKSETALEVYIPSAVAAGEGKIKFVTYKNEEYESPSINFKFPGVEPIVQPELVILSFDEELADNHSLGWDNWGGNVELGSDPNAGVSGKYMHGTNANVAAWTWIWGCNHSQLPKPSVNTNDHYFKVDIKITKAIPADANFQIEFAGVRIDLGNLGGITPNNGWVTITFDLAQFDQLPDVLDTDQGKEWGLNLQAGTFDMTGLYMDNFRFQSK